MSMDVSGTGGPSDVDIEALTLQRAGKGEKAEKAALKSAQRESEAKLEEAETPSMIAIKLTKQPGKVEVTKKRADVGLSVLVRIDEQADSEFNKFKNKDENKFIKLPQEKFVKLAKELVEVLKPDVTSEEIADHIEKSLEGSDPIVIVKAYIFLTELLKTRIDLLTKTDPKTYEHEILVLENKHNQLSAAAKVYTNKPEVKEAMKIASTRALEVASRVVDIQEKASLTSLAESLLEVVSKEIIPKKRINPATLSQEIYAYIGENVPDKKKSTVSKELGVMVEITRQKIESRETSETDKVGLKDLLQKLILAKEAFEAKFQDKIKSDIDQSNAQKPVLDLFRRMVHNEPTKSIFDKYRDFLNSPVDLKSILHHLGDALKGLDVKDLSDPESKALMGTLNTERQKLQGLLMIPKSIANFLKAGIRHLDQIGIWAKAPRPTGGAAAAT